MLYIDYIFDSFVLSYVIYTLLNIWLEKKAQKVPESLSFSKDHLATTAIDLNTDQPMKGSVKILKGEYDPEKTDGCSTEAVNLCIENHCLSISRPYLNDDEDVSMPTETYDLCGAKISLVPQHLEKKRHFLKKHPICVTLPLASKKWEDGSKNFDDLSQEEKRDFISLVELEDGLVERPKQRALYIFALTNREKEAWFHALTKCLTDCDSSFLQNMQIVNTSPTLDFSALSYSSLMEMNADESLAIVDDSSEKDSDIKLSPSEKKLYVYFDDYMKVLWENYQKVLHVVSSEDEHKCTSKRTEGQFKSSCCVEWLNVAVGRLFYDFLTQKKWCDKVIVKIQKKLDKIEMPNFVETLQVTDICMGSNLPQLHAVSNPSMDNLGLWFDFDFIYRGSFYMTLKTRLKIPKEKTFKGSDDQENESNKQNADGSEASDEDAASGSKKSPNKFISKLEKWMTHKHFKTVAQSRFVKKYVGDINNMPLTLTVEVNKLEGILSINIPPAPTDRIWFGFHKDPTLSVTASPKVGSTEINMSAVVQMIERKLVNAFKKALVMPHMEDLIIPIMFSPLSDE